MKIKVVVEGEYSQEVKVDSRVSKRQFLVHYSFFVLFDTSHQPVRTRPKRRTIYLWKKANIMEIKRSLQEYYRHFQSQSFSSVNEMWNSIKEEITKTIQDHVSTKRILARQTHHWVDGNIREATRRKLRA